WYQALSDPTDPLWADLQDSKEFVRELNLFGVKQYKPLVLSVTRNLERTAIRDVLRFCVTVSFRYTIIGDRNTNELEKIFNDIAVDIQDGVHLRTNQIREALSKIALSDEEFQDAFARKIIPSNGRGKRISRYILCALERQLGNADVHDATTAATIEHILPENTTPEWETFFPEDVHERYVYRLGNYTLLDGTRNREAEQKAFGLKLPIYRGSNYQITQRIDGAEWNPNAIESRQQQMAKWAKTVWKL
ncbi:MAG: HNH endonuclease family protein, partial [Rhabdochlamydiaceae bacterium]